MTLKKNIAAALRATRIAGGLGTHQLESACSPRTLERLEAGEINAPVDTLFALSNALDIDIATLMVLCIASHKRENPELTLRRVAAEIATFLAKDGESILKEQFAGEDLVLRSKGKPKKEDHLLAVKKLKAAGYTAPQVIKELGLPRSTVYDYWKLLS